MHRPRLLVVAATAMVIASCGIAPAQDQPARQLQGLLGKIASTGAITLGYRESSFPFSYLDPKGRPIGYSMDLCAGIVDEIGREIDRAQIRVAFSPVTAENRIARLIAGEIDLECGSTTINVERQKQVAFSPIIFVTGTKLMVKRSSGLRSFRDARGKVVVVTAGTTNEEAVKRLNTRLRIAAEIISAPDHEESYRRVVEGKADAFATDDVLLHGLIARHKAQRSLIVVGEFLSYDPYGIMFRKDDPQLAETVQRAFHRMAENGDLYEHYHRWFIRRTPTGERLDLPMTAQLTEFLRMLGMPD